jgi:hypothetical protein
MFALYKTQLSRFYKPHGFFCAVRTESVNTMHIVVAGLSHLGGPGLISGQFMWFFFLGGGGRQIGSG